MGASLRKDAETIIADSIREVQPDSAVIRALKEMTLTGKIKLVAAGKAAWQMAKAASNYLGERLEQGIVITKYGHVRGELPRIRCCEAGHPVPDEGSFDAARKALALTENLTKDDTVLFLLSGGGSALFELPLIPAEELQDVTRQLLACGADIVEINTLRKRLSAVKGGRFAQHCAPAKVFSIILSDILGDPPDMIASGPTCPDSSTCADAMEIVRRYDLSLREETKQLLMVETPKALANAQWMITGSVRELCDAAARSCRKLGYEPFFLTDRLCCQAREAGSVMASILRTHAGDGKKLAFLAGGETVVRLTGSGKGGRNQELALAAAEGISGLSNAALFSVGSDGTDGPTDAAGGFVDGATRQRLLEEGIHIDQVLLNNDAYHALQCTGGLIFTGPTGTNVNDVTVGLVEG